MPYDVQSALRRQSAWNMRRSGMKLREIAKELNVTNERARQIILSAERRLVRCAEHYDFTEPLDDPIHYGMIHIFTHEGRISLDNLRHL